MSPMRLFALSLLLAAPALASADASLTTLAEQSGFTRTGRYEEVERLCTAFANRWPKQVRCFSFGATPEGRAMWAIAASADGVLDAAAAKAANRPVVLIQGGIHAGEIDGKDAGFLLLREFLRGKGPRRALEKLTLVFVPVFNVDGHERFGRWNRPNQVGPEEMGWRTTAQNFNLNRDYVKAEAPEMQAMLRLLNAWDPILYIDLHATDGAQFEHDIAYVIAPTLAGPSPLRERVQALRNELLERMRKHGALPLDFYPSFEREDEPSSGFAAGVAPKRFAQQYWAARNRLGVLVETHSWKDYPTRVRRTQQTVVALLDMAARDAQQWLQAAREADAAAARVGGTNVTLAFENTEHVRTIEFRGYAYTREPSDVSGALLTRYDTSKPQIWRVPLKDEVRPAITTTAPRGGYIVPTAHAQWIGEKLALHGVDFRTLERPREAAPLHTFRATKAQLSEATFEGRTTLTLQGEWRPETRDIPTGSLFVPIAQARALLAMTLLEPQDPDSLASWGFFNGAFERKEYMEAYVAEDVARQMLATNPAVKAEFEAKLQEDPAFAKDSAARLDFFYRRHSSWDERYGLYPVYRTESSGW